MEGETRRARPVKKEAGQNRIRQSHPGVSNDGISCITLSLISVIVHQLSMLTSIAMYRIFRRHQEADDEGKHTFEQVPVGHADRARGSLELIAHAKIMDLSKASGT